jgi:6-pyruvoyltetrahydropterin/6-carboxytetrahydropterin synthase
VLDEEASALLGRYLDERSRRHSVTRSRFMEIFKEFTLEAAHLLPNVPEGHKCRRLHGHSFRVAVHVRGTVGVDSGWIMDFAAISDAFAPVFASLDHRFLNEVAGLSNPTSENLAVWIWERLEPTLAGLSKVVVRETCTSGCVYEGKGASES